MRAAGPFLRRHLSPRLRRRSGLPAPASRRPPHAAAPNAGRFLILHIASRPDSRRPVGRARRRAARRRHAGRGRSRSTTRHAEIFRRFGQPGHRATELTDAFAADAVLALIAPRRVTSAGFTGAGLDRADHLRLDAERLAALMAQWRRAAAAARRARSGAGRGRAAELGAARRRGARLIFPRARRGRAPVRAAGPDASARPARLERVPAAGADERAGRGDLGRGAQPQRMAQPPPLLRHLRLARPRSSAPAGAANARAAAPSISRASIRS